MPLAGGGADKAGNIYERHLTILAFIDVLEGSAHSVRIEVPGKEGAGAEFRQDGPAGSVWAQAKRQRDGGPWTIAQMREVLGSVWSKIESGDHFRFVSSTGAQELKELVDRAKNAESYDEFQEAFLVGDQLTRFGRLQVAWSNATPEHAYEGLRRVEVWLIDEERLSDMVELRLRALVTGSPATAAAVLGALVDGSTHRERRAEDIVDAFKKESIFLRELSRDAELQQRLAEQVQAHVAANRALIRQQELPRDEAGRVFELLGEQRRVTLAAGAGFGKSTAMVQVIDMARAEGWPVVVISADRLPAAASVYELGSKLGWPDSPATVLAGAAGTSNALLVIDQLDAVGIVSGRHTDRLSLVRDLILHAESYPHLRVLIGCRHFDLANDRELMAVAGAPGSTVVPLAELAEPIVQRALNDAGMTLTLPPKALTLLRVPLHLSIAIELGAEHSESVAAARTLTDLFDRYWGVKRAACRDARLGTDNWSDVVDKLTDWMSARQSLTAPRAVLDDFDAQAQVMASNGVISYEQQRVRFFHETFFDYCFARQFIHRGKSLRDMLTSTEQSLFRRAQVRQLLEYERSADPTQYAADLDWLLTSDDVRLHLKGLVIDLLGVVSDPGSREADMLVPLLLDNTSLLQPRAWLAVRGNPAWFPVLHDAGLWQAAITEESRQLTDRALWALGPALAEFPTARQLVRDLPDNPARIPRWRNVLTYSALLSQRVPLDLMAASIDQGMWDGEDASRDFWSIVHRVAESEAPTAVEIVRRLLARHIQSALTEGGSPFRNAGAFGGRTRGQAGQALMAAASSAPGDFVEAILPLMQLVMATTAYPRRSEDEGIADAVWGAQLVNGRHAVSDELFASMQNALQVLATDDPGRAAHAFRSLREVSFESGWFLLAKGYTANPGRFATDAADWLISTPGALDVGYLHSPTFVSRELITAIAPACMPDELERLVATVLSFTPYGERSYAALKRRGGAQFTLLNGIPAELRPSVAEQRLAELRRKFEMDDVPPPADFDFQEVPAPVPAERAVKMSDAQWLRAIAKHHDDEVGRWRDGRRVGNAVTQAPVLEEICRADPQRFGRLLLRFERGTAEPYITAVLDGLTGAMVDPDLLREVCEHARRIAGNVVDRSIVRLIGSHAAADLPHTLIALVGNIAMTSRDPSAADNLAPDLDASEAYGNIDITGMNCDRGAAVFTLCALLREMPARLPLVREALEHAASDRSVAVRAMAIAAYRPLIDFDADTALELFKTAVGSASSSLLTSQYVADFLAMMIRRGQYDRVAEVLDDMAASGAAEPSTAAAVQLITLASLLDGSLDPKVDAVLRGDAGGRLSVVRVCAINLKHNVRTGRAAELVMAAFDDPAAEVREAACQVFYEPVPFAQQLPLLGAFAHSAAAAHEVGGALHLLDESRQALPVVALEIFEQFVQKNGDKLGNMSTGEAAHGRLVVQLVLRVNAQSSSREVQTRCLDLIDQLVTVSAIGIDDDLASIER